MSHVLTVINDYEIQAVGPALALVLSHIISSQRSLLSRVAELSADPEHCVFRAALDEASALETGRNARRPPKAPWKWRSKVKQSRERISILLSLDFRRLAFSEGWLRVNTGCESVPPWAISHRASHRCGSQVLQGASRTAVGCSRLRSH